MFEANINSLKSGLVHLIGRPNSQMDRASNVKNGIISETKFLGTISVDRYNNIVYNSPKMSNIAKSKTTFIIFLPLSLS
jgi:hypothetical protein